MIIRTVAPPVGRCDTDKFYDCATDHKEPSTQDEPVEATRGLRFWFLLHFCAGFVRLVVDLSTIFFVIIYIYLFAEHS